MFSLAALKKVLISNKVDLYLEEIKSRNFKSFQAFAIVTTIISIMVLLFGLLMSHVVTFNTEFFIMFCYSVCMLLFSKLYLKKHIRYITLALYVAITPLMAMGIMMGTFLDPTEPSITIMVFLCVLTMFIIDKPWRVLCYITAVAAIYTVCCFIAKEQMVFIADMIDLVTFYFLAIGINCFVLNDRIDSVENFVKFRRKSETDLLTGIYNRGAGVEKIEQMLKKNVYGAFIIFDIDDFKQINDTHGHINGDEILQAVATATKDFFKPEDIVFRIGGDEFAVYVTGLTDREECSRSFNAFFAVLKEMKFPTVKDYVLGISLGCSICCEQGVSFEQLYKNSDHCLYEAKNSGKNSYYIKD